MEGPSILWLLDLPLGGRMMMSVCLLSAYDKNRGYMGVHPTVSSFSSSQS